ncbi:hypothetical protein BAUCODRAFT_451601 [Baudoinia panamericana UAMH 10762]|uniref:Uncharacterized protein n=1 Tax=Baudoinia panamericana (strain UAMH 10762) TaxID=717646 RepID=M2NDW6_BAUPA|nr:uncharacterized protein BAUCODRAFT_451601 [Baudoinia panamericana UAMH 10762]EMC97409.1 hypothetical protein BAUCODRAFT_451601 [Baudoinia panamericana UAMH 10762]
MASRFRHRTAASQVEQFVAAMASVCYSAAHDLPCTAESSMACDQQHLQASLDGMRLSCWQKMTFQAFARNPCRQRTVAFPARDSWQYSSIAFSSHLALQHVCIAIAINAALVLFCSSLSGEVALSAAERASGGDAE